MIDKVKINIVNTYRKSVKKIKYHIQGYEPECEDEHLHVIYDVSHPSFSVTVTKLSELDNYISVLPTQSTAPPSTKHVMLVISGAASSQCSLLRHLSATSHAWWWTSAPQTASGYAFTMGARIFGGIASPSPHLDPPLQPMMTSLCYSA